MLKSLKISAGGKSFTVDIESLKALHCKELTGLKEQSARSLTEVFFKDKAYLKKWLSRMLRSQKLEARSWISRYF